MIRQPREGGNAHGEAIGEISVDRHCRLMHLAVYFEATP